MNRPPSIPQNYLFYKGTWCHPSRVPRENRLVAQCINDDAPPTHAKAPRNDSVVVADTKTPKRIKQRQKPLLNALEQEWFERARLVYHERILVQAVGFRLGNGVVYWPDFVSQSFTHAWEIKGRQPIQDDSAVKIKVAARLYPQIKWSLCWKNPTGGWTQQVVLP